MHFDLYRATSNSGFEAPPTILKADYNMVPETDFEPVFSGNMTSRHWVPESQVLAQTGPSDAGTSILIRCFNRLAEPTWGKIYLDGLSSGVCAANVVA